jgi:phosphatidylglycerophosphate synthase
MAKYERELMHPVEALEYDAASVVGDVLWDMGFVPNDITMLSYATGVGAVAALVQGQYALSAGMLGISFFADCCDGACARRHNAESSYGDALDHVTDWLVFVMLIIVVAKTQKLSAKEWIAFGLITMVLLGLLAVHVGSEELLLDAKSGTQGENRESLQIFTKLCPTPEHPEETLRWSRWCGYAGLQIASIVGIAYLGISREKNVLKSTR